LQADGIRTGHSSAKEIVGQDFARSNLKASMKFLAQPKEESRGEMLTETVITAGIFWRPWTLSPRAIADASWLREFFSPKFLFFFEFYS
jgi:hypothetical protein